MGNLQNAPTYFQDIKLKIIIKFFFKILPRRIISLLIFFGFINKIEYRFISKLNEKKKFDKLTNFTKKFILYKNIKLVKSCAYNILKNNEKITDEIILLMDMYPKYSEMSQYYSYNDRDIKLHYRRLSLLLNQLSHEFKKQVIISIHPKYPYSFYKKYLKNFKVTKNKTNDLINKSFLILFFDSSAIIKAIILNKKIISIRSDLFKGKKNYNSDIYSSKLNNQSIKLSDNYNIDKKKLIIKLNKSVKKYQLYKNNFLGDKLKSKDTEILKNYAKKYFQKSFHFNG